MYYSSRKIFETQIRLYQVLTLTHGNHSLNRA